MESETQQAGNGDDQDAGSRSGTATADAMVAMGWGRLLFGETFDDAAELARVLCEEADDARDIAFQLTDPHVVIAHAPHELFLDPSHTYRLRIEDYANLPSRGGRDPVAVRPARQDEIAAIDRILTQRGMVPLGERFQPGADGAVTLLIAIDRRHGEIVGTVTAVDHVAAYDDPQHGSSLWCLAVAPDTAIPGVGEALVHAVCTRMFARGRRFVDLSVVHDNRSAIRLYEKLGFLRRREFAVKRRNPINEPLFSSPNASVKMNPYAEIIVNEARRRGIAVRVIDSEDAIFELQFGGRVVRCRESLSDLTSAVALRICDDKRLTRHVLREAGLRVTRQRRVVGDLADVLELLGDCREVVVKPARGEQGRGVSVGVRDRESLLGAIETARRECEDVVVEECVPGDDLRIIVIGDQVVAAALRRPPRICGTGEHDLRSLIERYDRRRRAATGGESRVMIDDDTRRCLADQGFGLDDVLPPGVEVQLRRTANLHTGGTIHDVTADLHPRLAHVAIRAARALAIPVVGLDLIVESPDRPTYCIIEANERPGLANHEPQPTAERFVDLLFPQTIRARDGGGAA